MKKYLAQLRPVERRLVVGVGVVLILVLNWAFVWPHFSDYHDFKDRFDRATIKLRNEKAKVDLKTGFEKKLKVFETQGEVMATEDQAIDLMRTIQGQARACELGGPDFGRPTMQTNEFFVEQTINIKVLAPEANLVDFLYKLGNSSAMIQVRDLSLSPDGPRQRLQADIRLKASYQKSARAAAAAPAAKSATVKAK
jgi:Tfp pilus assembly protein PilO